MYILTRGSKYLTAGFIWTSDITRADEYTQEGADRMLKYGQFGAGVSIEYVREGFKEVFEGEVEFFSYQRAS